MNLSQLGRCLLSSYGTGLLKSAALPCLSVPVKSAVLPCISVRQLRTFAPDRTTSGRPKPLPVHQSIVEETDNGQSIKVEMSL